MKKHFIILFFLSVFLHFQSQAQLKWGYKVGLGLSYINSANVGYAGGSTTSAFSYQGGIVAETPLKGENLVFQPALLYCKKGDAVYTKTYLDIPLNVIFKTTSNFQFGAGPVISFLLADKVGTNKSIDLGGNLLLGYNLTENSSLNFNYTFSLANAVKSDFYTNKNAVFSVSLVQFLEK
ncbi:hypothetical protein VB796_01760 [Arcicella sp. LKC2W]|uniref:hypothetical protein n=1 Tax=Arcicella sp. LKC2W TaxID=2984198 RepID=UPI002B211D8B|nr:hypothetical protein [Arcicella sp. LKC2W]MEA5457743.1 hypothetical protein [Arcicella sp. LKC2W]